MTTTVTVHAHCADDEQVLVVVTDDSGLVEGRTLQDGEQTELYAHDDRVISVKEERK